MSYSTNDRAISFLFLLATAALVVIGFAPAAHGTPKLRSANATQTGRDNALVAARRSDARSRDKSGKLSRLDPAEHLRRAATYMSNRAFAEAREHWQALIDYYPENPSLPEAMFGIGRSYFQGREYKQAFEVFARLARIYPSTTEGRDGLNFSAASLLRLGKFSEAARTYMQYVDLFPAGERIETAHLNVIDTLREAGRITEALDWVNKTKQKFPASTTETNAVFAQLRLYISESDWQHAIIACDQLSRLSFQKGVLTTRAEIAYLRAYSLEKQGQKDNAFSAYLNIPDGIDLYYGWLASERMRSLANEGQRALVDGRIEAVNSRIAGAAAAYPAPYRQTILRVAHARKLDPRFILALIRQESAFRPLAKSPAGARGLLQLTMDAAEKYARPAGLPGLREDQLYQPDTSVLLGAAYIAELSRMFPGMLEAVAASYNGGEDNVTRWVTRAHHTDPGVFTAEVGFDETKDYVQKVMTNYRVYRQLYTADLIRK